MIYRPPPHSLKPFSAPPVMQYRIDASDDWQAQNGQVAAIVADAIVESYSSSISQFINNQRQQMRLGIIAQQRHQMTLPGIVVDYGSNHGNETIRITVKPEYVNLLSLPLLIDINLDGYVAYVHTWQQLPAPGIDNAPIDLILNGYGVITNYTPDDDLLALYQPAQEPDPPAAPVFQATVMFIVAFGPTALRCQSIQDLTVNKVPVLVNNGNAVNLNTFAAEKKSGGPLPPVSPPRKNIAASGNAPTHKDLLGYFVFNWGDQFNPDSWAYNGDQGVGPDYTFTANFPVPDIIKVIQFETAKKSPLVVAGKNNFYAQHSSTPALNTGQNADDFLCAEFYNRANLRVATSSWTYPNASAGVLVNDQPIYFACDGGDPFSDVGARTNFGLNFDLTPVKSPSEAVPFGTASPTPEVITPLTADQQAALTANAAAAVIYSTAYNAALATLNTAQQALVTANQNIIIPSRGSDVTLAYAYAATPNPSTLASLIADVGETVALLLVAYAQASLAFQAHPTSVSFLHAFNTAEINLGGAATLVVGDYLGILANQSAYGYSVAYSTAYNAAIASGQSQAEASAAAAAALNTSLAGLNSTENALISYATSQGETALAAAATSALAAMIAAENALIAVQNNYVPVVVQSDNYQPISAFSYRVITVANGVWTFGAYS
jgi:hypothetical protein